MSRRRLSGVLAAALVALVGCGERPTDPSVEGARLSLVPVFAQRSGDLPVLPVDEVLVRVTEAEGGALLAEVSEAVPAAAAEVEVEVRLDVTPGTAVAVRLALRGAARDVYVGGPITVVPSEDPVDVPVEYVGADACGEATGTAVIGSVGAAPGIVQGRLDVGDCYVGADDSFADRWTVAVPRDAGLSFAVEPTGQGGPLRLRLESPDGTVLVDGSQSAFDLFIGAGTYVAVVTSALPVATTDYELSVGEFDRCDSETGVLTPGTSRSQALTEIDCPLASGRSADLWGLVLTAPTPYRIDLESTAFDAQLLLTPPGVLDPFLGQVIAADDDRGLGTNALLAGELPPGAYRVWATSFLSDERGPYEIEMRTLQRGAPSLEVRSVTALGTGSVCGTSQGFRFDFGFEDGDGDLTEGGGVTIRLTGVPSGFQEVKTLGWEGFDDQDLSPYAGFAEVLTCETFGSDSGKVAEFFITDASERASPIYTTTLTRPSTSAPPTAAPASRAVLRPAASAPTQSSGGRNR